MSYSNSPSDHHQEFQYAYSTTHGYPYISDGSTIAGDESNFWSNSTRSDSPSPNVLHSQNQIDSSYQIYTNSGCSSNNHYSPYVTTYQTITEPGIGTSFVRVVKRRTTANKKERRRTQSINNAYSDLRDCIPNVKSDTKLSKIKTLRLATSYISYLTRALETDDTPANFRAELGNLSRKSSVSNSSTTSSSNHHHVSNNNNCSNDHGSPKSDISEETANSRKSKGRTGWPQHIWALEIKQEQAL